MLEDAPTEMLDLELEQAVPPFEKAGSDLVQKEEPEEATLEDD